MTFLSTSDLETRIYHHQSHFQFLKTYWILQEPLHGAPVLSATSGSHTQHWLQYARNHAETETNGPCNVAAALPGATMSQHTSQLFTMEPIYIVYVNVGFLPHAMQEHPKRKTATGGKHSKFWSTRNAQWNRKDTTKDLL